MAIAPVKPEEIIFDEEAHTYTVRGERWPGVTSILDPYLNDFSHVPAETLKRAREWGTAVHHMVELYEQNDLSVESLDPALVRVLRQYAKAIDAMKWRVVACEVPVAHALHRYAGKLDLIAYAGDRKTADEIDVKTGVFPASVGPQTGAYAEAYHHMKFEHRIGRRFCLYLSQDKYQISPLKGQSDFTTFLSCLNITRFKEHHNVGH